MPKGKKKRKVEEVEKSNESGETYDEIAYHEKNHINIDIKKYFLEEIALLLGEFFAAQDSFQNSQRK